MKPEHAQLLTRLIEQHPYLTRECSRYPLHDAIHKAQALHGLEPANMEELLLEWPHLSNDQARLAYTRTPAHGEADRQTVTTLGRYLTKCFPTAKSDVIRDIAALYQGSGCKFTERTTAAYIDAVQNGPSSCMQWAHLKSESEHPYNVYAPELGWHMAVNIMGVKICGRCMCLEYNGEKTFVRSYHQSPDGTYSPSDTVLEAWLKDQGYTRKTAWPIGAKLAEIYRDNGDLLVPYLDGNVQNIAHGDGVMLIDPDGSMSAQATNGTYEETETCDHCHEGCSETNSVGSRGYTSVCNYCLENYHTWVYGRGGDTYYVHDEEAITVGDYSYDKDYLDENGIVFIESGRDEGEYAHQDDVVTDIHDNRWSEDDPDIEYIQHGVNEGSYVPSDETWVCEGSGYTYTDDDESKEVDGARYHVDFEITETESEEQPSEVPHAND